MDARHDDLSKTGRPETTDNDLQQLAPLVVALDGTLLKSDTLLESIVQMVKNAPINVVLLPIWFVRGLSFLKEQVAARATISAALLPYRQDLLSYLREQKKLGRVIILITSNYQSIANDIAKHFGLFDAVLVLHGSQQDSEVEKIRAIKEKCGNAFVYAGSEYADSPIWHAAEAAVLVGLSQHMVSSIRKKTPVEKEFPKESTEISVWIRALRLHQWLKNLLLFVPLLTSFIFTDALILSKLVVAFLAFSLAASATYLLNDIWDIESDRGHPRKQMRPFASGRISITSGIAVAVLLLLTSLGIARTVSTEFFWMLILYIALTSAYSWVLKGYVLLDVIMLSMLYTLRIIAGAIVIGVHTSSWLLAFSVFMFLSLALVKRCSELLLLKLSGGEITRGRDYHVTDLVVLWPLGLATALSSVVIFGLFISTPDNQARYATPELLWLVALGLFYWLSRLWIKTARGEMHDDPVVYAIKDFGSRTTIFAIFVTLLTARFAALGSQV